MRYKCYGHQDEIRQWAAEGLGISQIAAKLGVQRKHVRNFLKKMQIPVQRQSHEGGNNPAWKGGRVIDKDGYVLAKANWHPLKDRHGYVREHRLVMEEKLGRFLTAEEVVHHLNSNKQDNRPENLGLFAKNGDHLAETLKGKVPNWTPEGLSRIRSLKRDARGRLMSARDADRSPESSAQIPT